MEGAIETQTPQYIDSSNKKGFESRLQSNQSFMTPNRRKSEYGDQPDPNDPRYQNTLQVSLRQPIGPNIIMHAQS